MAGVSWAFSATIVKHSRRGVHLLGKCATDGNGREQPAAGEEPGLGQAGVGAAGAAGSGGKRQAAGGAGAARSHRHDSTRRKGGPYTTRRTGAGAGLGGVAATHGALVV